MVIHLFSSEPDAPYQRTVKRWEYLPDKWRVEVWHYASDADEDGKMVEYATFSGLRAEALSQLFADNFSGIEKRHEP